MQKIEVTSLSHAQRGDELVGVSAVLPTIYTDEDAVRIDLDAMAHVAQYLSGQGISALAVGGIASEPWALTGIEAQEILRVVVETICGDVPILTGIDQQSRVAVRAAEDAARLGATHLMVRPPSALDEDGMISYLGRLSAASGLPLVLQDVPQISNVGLSVRMLRSVVDSIPTVCALKLEGLNSGPMVSALADLPLPLIMGWGGVHFIERLERGANGCMPGAATSPTFVQIYKAWQSGDITVAAQLYGQLVPLIVYASQSLELMITVSKRMLLRLGIISCAAVNSLGAAPDRTQIRVIEKLLDDILIPEGGG